MSAKNINCIRTLTLNIGFLEGEIMRKMKKNIFNVIRNLICILVIILLITTLFVIRYENGSQAQQVIISEDTTWTLANSPYIITGNVLVELGKNLTIEPGVEVKFDGFYSIQIEGKLVAEGTENNMITFTSNKTSPTPGDWSAIKLINNALDGTIFKYCKIEYANVAILIAQVNFSIAPNITYCDISNNRNHGIRYYTELPSISIDNPQKELSNNSLTNNGGFGIDIEFLEYNNSRLFIINNMIRNNDAGGINFYATAGNLTISYNKIIRNKGTGIYCNYGENVYIRNNLILLNNDSGIVIEEEYSVLIEHNTILNNSDLIDSQGGGIDYTRNEEESKTKIRYNNIFNNSPYDARNSWELDGNISNNWWGTTETGVIEQNIFDYYDDFNKGKLNYTPFLMELDLEAPDPSEYFKEPPITPTIPIGMTSGIINISYFYSTFATEPNGEQIRYGWDWNGNGAVDEWSDFINSGSNENRSHLWLETGTYHVKVKVVDEFGAESPWSDELSVTISIPPNDSPNNPIQISGKNSGKINTSYTFSISTTDPDRNRIKYGWDWDGNGLVDEWSSLLESGTKDTRSHNWSTKGIYKVKVRAEDEYGGESDWSDDFIVTISEDAIESNTNTDNNIIIPLFLVIIIIIVIIMVILNYLRKRS
jgi:hypothetical protein